MSYVALYRKWRPKTFDEVKGQEHICRTLKNQIVNNRIGHAFLFCGTRGTGKTSVAKILARAVNCTNSKDGNPCNQCEICKGILQEKLMNVVEIDAASNNGVDNIRDIKEQVMYPPTSGKYKVYIIDEAHMLSTGAFNALLKTLEEPPEYVIFILATTEVQKILSTIISRCQRYDFKRIDAETIFERLSLLCNEENIDIEDRALELIAKRADGAMRDALSLLDECSAYYQDKKIGYDEVLEVLGIADVSSYNKLFEALVNKDLSLALSVVDELVISGRELSQFVNDFIWYLRNALVIKSIENFSSIVETTSENREIIANITARVSKEMIIRDIKMFSELSSRMKYSSQKRVLLEVEIIRMVTPTMDLSLDSALERIASLEDNIKEGIIVPEIKKKENRVEDRVVKIDKASYDDFILLSKEWGHIVGSMERFYAIIFSDTTLEIRNDGSIEVIFAAKSNCEHALRHNCTELIEKTVAERLNKRFHFKFTGKEKKHNTQIKYVTKDEISNIINMEIEEE